MGRDHTSHQVQLRAPQSREHIIQKIAEWSCPQHAHCHTENTLKADQGDLLRYLSWAAGDTKPVGFAIVGALGDMPRNQTISHAVEEGRKSWDESHAHPT